MALSREPETNFDDISVYYMIGTHVHDNPPLDPVKVTSELRDICRQVPPHQKSTARLEVVPEGAPITSLIAAALRREERVRAVE